MKIWRPSPHPEIAVEPGEFVKVIPENWHEMQALGWLYRCSPQFLRPMDIWTGFGPSPLMVRVPLPVRSNIPVQLYAIEEWLSDQARKEKHAND